MRYDTVDIIPQKGQSMKDYMREISAEEAISAGHTDTLCWDCKRALKGECSWSDPYQQSPVEGWKAEKTSVGYRVVTCPEFVRETYGCGRYRSHDDYILALETALTTRKKQVAKIKNLPDLLRKKNAVLKRKNEKLNDELMKFEWFYTVHMSD